MAPWNIGTWALSRTGRVLVLEVNCVDGPRQIGDLTLVIARIPGSRLTNFPSCHVVHSAKVFQAPWQMGCLGLSGNFVRSGLTWHGGGVAPTPIFPGGWEAWKDDFDQPGSNWFCFLLANSDSMNQNCTLQQFSMTTRRHGPWGTMETWFPGSRGPCFHETYGPSYLGALKSWRRGSLTTGLPASN